MQAGYDINILFQEAQTRWLKPAEVLHILQNHEKYQLNQEPPQRPPSGSLFLFNKRVLRFFRKDGHNWRKKKDGRAVGEAHERLKVGNVEALNCYYAHGEQNPNFQRRSYWMLDPAYEHIVLVHYREITEGRPSPGSVAVSPGASSSFILSPTSYTTQNPGSNSVISDSHEPYQSLSSPSSVEVSSETAIRDNSVEGKGEIPSNAEADVNQALRRLEEQLSLNEDTFVEFDSFPSQNLQYRSEMSKQDQFGALLQSPEYIVHGQYNGGQACFQDNSDNPVLYQDAGDDGKDLYGHGYTVGSKETLSWKEVLDSCNSSSSVEFQGKPLSSSRTGPTEEQEHSCWPNSNGSVIENSALLLHQEVENFKIPPYSSVIGTHGSISDYFTMFDRQDHIGVSLEPDLHLTVAEKLKFKIREISPEWGYATEATKVIIVGSFLCDPSESAWSCMFDDTEVPLQIVQEGVIRCEAPPHLPGKVALCITSGNQESCSEIKEFEYRVKNSSYSHDNLSQKEATRSRDYLLLLVRFVQMLLSDSSMQKGNSVESESHVFRGMKADDDVWGQVIEALLVGGGGTSFDFTDWLLQELLKDKLHQWLSLKSIREFDQPGCTLTKKEQGIIHMIAGLGFEWALNPILSHGVGINFRDINGWTALHWAARFGREKMVAALLASGASAGAVTDPNSLDPAGKTPASIAASGGHKGLAGYLSEVALTSHLSSLTLEECELSKGSAEVEVEITVNSVSNASLSTPEDQLSLKDTLAAVRNATQAAARIQSAFRAHSFRKRLEREAAAADGNLDEYDIEGLSALSKLTFRNARDYNSAALSIQKKYRGWKGRKDFLALRQKVVKIQAHVRGYQVRKKYKVICWAVGVLDKVILRWRRKGVGLRGFRPESESNEESEDEDILKVFRRQKVDVAIDEAVSRVLSMVDSPVARQQYHRMLERFRQAKAERGETSEEMASTSADDIAYMEDDDWYQLI